MPTIPEILQNATNTLANTFGVAMSYIPSGGVAFDITAKKFAEKVHEQDEDFGETSEIRCEFTIYGDNPRPMPGDEIKVSDDEVWTIAPDGVLEFIPGRRAMVSCTQEFSSRSGSKQTWREGLKQ